MDEWFKHAVSENREPWHTYLAVCVYTHDVKQQNRTDLTHLKDWRSKNYFPKELSKLASLLKGRAVRLGHNADGSSPEQVGKVVETHVLPSRKEVYAVFAIDSKKHPDIVDGLRTGRYIGASLRELVGKRVFTVENSDAKILLKRLVDVSLVSSDDPPNRHGCHILLSAQTSERADDIILHDDTKQLRPVEPRYQSLKMSADTTAATPEAGSTPAQKETPEEEGERIYKELKQKVKQLTEENAKKETLLNVRESQDKDRYNASAKLLETLLKGALANQPDAQQSAEELMKARDLIKGDAEWLTKDAFNEHFMTIVHSVSGGTKHKNPRLNNSTTDSLTSTNDDMLQQQLQPTPHSSDRLSSGGFASFAKQAGGDPDFMTTFHSRK